MALEPDLLLVNANVITMDPARPRARAVAVSGGRIAGVYDGEPDTSGPTVIDLSGATLIPGFHDAHNHMIGFGLALTEADLRVTSLDELYGRVAERARTTPEGEWVVGSGYDQTKTGGHPHRDALDAAAPGKRVWLKHTSGHMCVVSSLVLRDLGIDATAPYVDGGRVAADDAGRPTGLLEERAQELVGELTRPYPLGTLTEAVASAATELGDGMMAAVGPRRTPWLYRQRSLLDAGLVLPGSSDRPVAAGAPLLGMHDMVNRRTTSGAPFNAGEAVTAFEALRVHLRLRLREQARGPQGVDRAGQASRPHGPF